MVLGVGHTACCPLAFSPSLLILSFPKVKFRVFWKAGVPTQKVGSEGTVGHTSRRRRRYALAHSVSWAPNQVPSPPLPFEVISSKGHILRGFNLDLRKCSSGGGGWGGAGKEHKVLFVKSKFSLCKVERLQNSPGRGEGGGRSKLILAH